MGMCMYMTGVYSYPIHDSECTRLSKDRWSLSQGVVRSPKMPNSVTLFHSRGIFRIDVDGGAYVKLASSSWSCTKAVLYDPLTDAAIVFHDHGMYRVSLVDGTSTKVGTH